MKELTIEQKAKRYDEAIERARLVLQERGNEPDGASILSELFPELKEREDERTRKEITTYLKSVIANKGYGDKIIESWIAWLEKQGEPTDINPSEFDLRLNKLLKQFETLSKEELASSLSFYLNVVQNDGTYKDEEKQDKQKPVAWSEEDEGWLDNAIVSCEQCGNTGTADWLKSLRPQSHWKPSDEQMLAISTAINVLGKGTLNGKQLIELQEKLKKLKG